MNEDFKLIIMSEIFLNFQVLGDSNNSRTILRFEKWIKLHCKSVFFFCCTIIIFSSQNIGFINVDKFNVNLAWS
jgi:hypothetical protein